MTTNGLLLLDVDGPLYPYDAKPSRRPVGYNTYRYVAPNGWYTDREYRRTRLKHALRVWLNPDHGPMLLDLVAHTGLELVWATSWGDLANTCIGPTIGLPTLPVVPFGPPDWTPAGWSSSGAWKWRAVEQYAAGRPLAWLDDEHNYPAYAHNWTAFLDAREAFHRRRAGIPTLLAHINPQIGLQPTDLDVVRQWVTDHTEPRPRGIVVP